MDHIATIQRVLEIIDEHITEKLTVVQLAESCNYSVYYFCHIFEKLMGIPVMSYITRRKLQYALSDLACGKKIVDIAMEYGYETHAGFTKAFKRCFGYPPSLYWMHAEVNPPKKIELSEFLNNISGGISMLTQIVEKKPFTIVGYYSQHILPNVKYTHDIPVYWDKINMEYSEMLTTLHDTFNRSTHCEYSICSDADIKTGKFTYLLGVGVDNKDDMSKINEDMNRLDMPGGLYAIFTTPLVDESHYAESISETWKNILDKWLPDSEYEFDEDRLDFEYYDKRDHAWENNNKAQMDIYIPICKRK